MKLIVTGATGFIGSQLVASTISKGMTTLSILRTDEKARRLGIGRWLLMEDLSGERLLETGFESAAMVHLIGTSRDEPGCSMRESIVQTTLRVIKAAQEARVSRFVYMSGYGVSHNSSEVYFRSKAEAESIIRSSGIPYVVFRASYILGPGDEFTPYLVQQLQNGLVEIPGDGSYRLQPVYIDDVIDLIIRAACLKGDGDYSFDLLGPAISLSAYVDLLSEKVGKHAIIRHEKLETFIRRATLSLDPVFTTGELAVLVCDLVGPVTENCLGVRIRGIEETLDSWIKTI